jgi:hypothetical protein
MEEAITATVPWFDPTSQISPSIDLVNCFIANDSFKEPSGRIPLNWAQLQESHIEPIAKSIIECIG